MKVVVNRCYGGFGLSHEAEDLYAKKAGFEVFRYKDGGGRNKFVRWNDGDSYFSCYSFNKDLGDGFTDYPNWTFWSSNEIKRDDPLLIEVVEELGDKANGRHAALEIVEIPDGIDWGIDEYDGKERVKESHRSW
jgi:hypothetical protein